MSSSIRVTDPEITWQEKLELIKQLTPADPPKFTPFTGFIQVQSYVNIQEIPGPSHWAWGSGLTEEEAIEDLWSKIRLETSGILFRVLYEVYVVEPLENPNEIIRQYYKFDPSSRSWVKTRRTSHPNRFLRGSCPIRS